MKCRKYLWPSSSTRSIVLTIHPIGRQPNQSPKSAATAKLAAQTRLNRRNHSKQLQNHKRHTLVSATRIFSGSDGAPRIVAIVPLSEDVNPQSVAKAFAASLDASTEDRPESCLWRLRYYSRIFRELKALTKIVISRAERFKTSLQLAILPYRNFYATLDTCKAADYVVFALSSEVEVDTWGDTLLRTLQAQGLPEVVTVICPPSPIDPKSKSGIMKSLLSFIQYFVPTQTRIFDLHTPSDQLNAVRALCEGKPEEVKWRAGRAWVLGEKVEWVEGLLGITGVIRGAPLSANRLVHLPNHGDFQISRVSFKSDLPDLGPNSILNVDYVRHPPETIETGKCIYGT